jgi:hypothetical protein
MKIINGALVREQNENDVDDSCFDSSELYHMLDKLRWAGEPRQWPNLSQFIIDGKLQRHPQTKFMDDISSDQAHMFMLAYPRFNDWFISFKPAGWFWFKTSNNNLISFGLWALLTEVKLWQNLSLLIQIILFWIPIRWCDGDNPNFRLGFIKLNCGYRHHCGDYRLFKQCLYYAPKWIKRMVSKKTLRRMTRYYWYGEKWSPPAYWIGDEMPGNIFEPKEPNIDWLIEIDDRFVEECL